jgi:PAS domain S-box-containing protein
MLCVVVRVDRPCSLRDSLRAIATLSGVGLHAVRSCNIHNHCVIGLVSPLVSSTLQFDPQIGIINIAQIMKNHATIGQILIDIIPDMCFVVSTDRKVLAYNQTARELLGLPEMATGDLHFYSLLTDHSPRPLLPVLRTKRQSHEAEVQFKRKDGQRIDALLFIRKISGPDQEFLYVVARDVSEEKQKELDLLRFSNVVHYTVNPIQITDSEGRMVYVNPAFEKASGYMKEELIGLNPNILSSGKYAKEFWRGMWDTIKAGNVWNGEIENRKKNGEPFYTQLLISPIIDGEAKVVGFLGSHRDITKQKQLEQQLMHSQKMESIGTLAAGIAHEVGNPLTSISSIVQVLHRTTQDEFFRSKLSLVQSQVHRITKIIRDLVDFSRPSNYQLQPTDVVKVVTDAVEIVKMGKKAKEVEFVTSVRQKIPPLSLVPDQISQVFINILLNAVDAMDGKKGKVETVIDQYDETVRVKITDDGCGIAPEHVQKIFTPFFTTKRVGEGTGLGLWVSYGIMESFGGDITVESQRGQGTTFCVILPMNAREVPYA